MGMTVDTPTRAPVSAWIETGLHGRFSVPDMRSQVTYGEWRDLLQKSLGNRFERRRRSRRDSTIRR